jgi:hypothetical protein
MNPSKINPPMASALLMLPALFLCSSGILYSGFGVAEANTLLERLMANGWFKWLLSPAAVLGGPMIAAGLNAWKVLHLSADIVNEEFVIALSVKRVAGHLAIIAVAGGLVLVTLGYTFVENFQIVAR